MDICPKCGYSPTPEDACDAGDCTNPAKYEGWVRVRDGFGIPTGLIQRRRLCSEHSYAFIANEPPANASYEEWLAKERKAEDEMSTP